MSEDLAQALGAEDYEYLRSRAQAHLTAVESVADRPRTVRRFERGSGDPRTTPTRPRVATAPRAYGSRIGSAPPDYVSPYGGERGRRTIQITGQPDPRPRRSAATRVERIAMTPDRVAMWAVLLGLFLVVMAIATAHA